MKILAPSGNFDSLKAAVFNGADEVYLGVNEFNARNNIDGFNMDNLKTAVDFAHVYGVKVCLAVNILFSDDEMNSALDLVADAFNMGVDAFIIQDVGLMSLVKEHYPEITIHASTQMGLHNAEGVKAVKKFDVKRVVLARETPLDEVERIKSECDVEIEFFAHGALCVCFSGNCYLSSYLNDASGNRGRCKQLCRLNYTLEKDGKALKKGYLLSAKDFDMTDKIKDLEKVGVDVLKIEGRARRPFYVGAATSAYRNILDGGKADKEELALAFNRGFIPGYTEGNANVISRIQNHVGVPFGTVVKFNKGKRFNEIVIKSLRNLSAGSALKFFGGEKERTVISAHDVKALDKNLYKITSTQSVGVGDTVNLIVDSEKEKEVELRTKKRQVELFLSIKIGQPMRCDALIEDKKITVFGFSPERANMRPTNKKEIEDNFLKSEYFVGKIEFLEFESVFIPKQKANEFRRNVFLKIYEELTEKKGEKVQRVKLKNDYKIKPFTDFIFTDKMQFDVEEKNVIFSPETYTLEEVESFKNYCEKHGKNAYLDTPNFATSKDVELLKNIIENTKISIVANNYYALLFDTEMVIGAGLNVFNTYSAKVFDKPVVCAESEVSTRINYPYMTLRHCPMKNHLLGDCKNCPYTDGFIYRTESGKVLKLKRKKLSSCTFYLTD